ncbi:unnamed protein product [Adineta steineri]|uniref:Uncharacterized protein n=1 Tax=Adineta steineri TaxID=433720 RepID=A0A814EP62_9BILA|nr:unnamed protein product [Adineta steineri]CAF0974009.1 unnamed protein product [Adineta steineri]CAF4079261.1 unnamed protein product [Adineta steineri]CAF4115691.1 unnamed protein product [Adineta steineri]
MTTQSSDFMFRIYSMHNYEQHITEINDLFQRCKSTDNKSVFHCESIDDLHCMKQYPESYCCILVDPKDGRVVAIAATNIKFVYFGSSLVTVMFNRLGRVDPALRRQHLAINLATQAYQTGLEHVPDYIMSYTGYTNVPSSGVQQRFYGSLSSPVSRFNHFILPTRTNSKAVKLYKLSFEETERLWMVDMIDWVQRPSPSDIHRIMHMDEYIGTFAVGDFSSQQYAAAMIWEPLTAILCDDRSGTKNAYRGRFRLVLNFFQSSNSIPSVTAHEREHLISALSNAAANDKIPFLMCDIEESSPFTSLVQQKALAMTTANISRIPQSQRFTDMVDRFANSPIWLDPRDFGTLLYLKPVSEKLQSQL